LLCRPEPIFVQRRYQFPAFAFTTEGGNAMLTVKDTEVPGSVDVTISFVDSKGKPAKVDGVPTWAVDNTAVVDVLTPAADGMSAHLHITDNVGAAQLTVTADADLGTGVTTITSVDTVSVIPGDAVAAQFNFGTVTPDTPPGP
jgi:hypothetical protein